MNIFELLGLDKEKLIFIDGQAFVPVPSLMKLLGLKRNSFLLTMKAFPKMFEYHQLKKVVIFGDKKGGTDATNFISEKQALLLIIHNQKSDYAIKFRSFLLSLLYDHYGLGTKEIDPSMESYIEQRIKSVALVKELEALWK